MEQQVNLYQPILRAEKRLFSAGAIALGLALLAVSLGALAGFAGWRTARMESAVAALEVQEAARLALTERASAALAPAAGLAELEAGAAALAQGIAARERALATVGTGSATTSGFAARLAALGRPPVEGLWLDRVVIAPGGAVAIRGLATDPRRVPQYLGGLRAEGALAGARFEGFEVRRAAESDAPAVAAFVVNGPGLALGFDAEERP